MYQYGKILLGIFAVLVFLSTGCSKRDPNPELRDPIYLDLKDAVGNLTRDVSAFEATVSEEKDKKDNAEPRTKDLALAKKRLYEADKKWEKSKQKLKYYEIKLERRKLETRLAYEKSLQNDKPWPDPSEYRAYLANKDLRNAKSQWSARVPKLKDRVHEYEAGQK